jgi:uncharacterized membrane protein YgcG
VTVRPGAVVLFPCVVAVRVCPGATVLVPWVVVVFVRPGAVVLFPCVVVVRVCPGATVLFPWVVVVVRLGTVAPLPWARTGATGTSITAGRAGRRSEAEGSRDRSGFTIGGGPNVGRSTCANGIPVTGMRPSPPSTVATSHAKKT